MILRTSIQEIYRIKVVAHLRSLSSEKWKNIGSKFVLKLCCEQTTGRQQRVNKTNVMQSREHFW